MKTWLTEHGKYLDGANIVAGVALALSPWYLAYAAGGAAFWNAVIVGAAIALIAIAAVARFHQAEEWVNLLLGLWAIAAPWLLGFAAVTGAVGAHVIVGVVVAAIAAYRLWSDGQSSLTA